MIDEFFTNWRWSRCTLSEPEKVGSGSFLPVVKSLGITNWSIEYPRAHVNAYGAYLYT